MEATDTWSLPGPSGFADRVATFLAAKQHVAVCRPIAGLSVGLPSAIREATTATWIESAPTIELSELGSEPDPSHLLHALAELLVGNGAAGSSPARLLESLDVGVVLTVTAQTLVDGTGQAWWGVVNRLAAANTQARARVATLTVCHDLATPQCGEPTVRAACWRGTVDPFDSVVYVRLRLGERYREFDPVLASMISEVSMFDLELADLLLDESWNGDEVTLDDLLDQRWAGRPDEARDCGSQDIHAAWLHGMLDTWTGCDTYSSDTPPGRAAVRSRIWRAQTGTLFRELDECRALILDYARRRGNKTFLDRILDEPEVDDLDDAEIGLLHKHSGALQSATAQIDWLRRTRNALAHRRPVSLTEINRGRLLFKDLA